MASIASTEWTGGVYKERPIQSGESSGEIERATTCPNPSRRRRPRRRRRRRRPRPPRGMALGRLASRVRGSALQVRAAAPRASPPAPCPCVRPMTYSSKPVQGGQQSKGVDLYPASPIDLLRESKWRNVKDDGAVSYGAGIHTSAPRVPPPAPRTTPLAGGQPVSCRSTSSETVKFGAGVQTSAPRVPLPAPSTSPVAGGQPVFCRRTSSSQVVSFGVPALPVARRLSRPAITAYGPTCFGPRQQQRGFAQMPFQSVDSKTAAAMYDQLSPEGQSMASLANMAGNEAARKMELWNKQKFDSIDLGLKELTDEITVLGLTGVYAVAAASAVVWYVYLVIEESVVELSGKYGEMAAALLNGLLRSFLPMVR